MAADPLTGPLPAAQAPADTEPTRHGSARLAASLRSGSPPHWLEMLRAEARAGLADDAAGSGVPRENRSPTAARGGAAPGGAAWSLEPERQDASAGRSAPSAAEATDATPAESAESPGPDAVLTAVRELPGVRDAELLGEPGRQQVLRLDLVASVDPNVVGRQAAALLRDQLGVHAAVRARGYEPSLTPRFATDARRLTDDAADTDPPHRNRRRDRSKSPDQAGAGQLPPVSVEQVQVVTAGLEAAVEVGLAVAGVRVAGRASGPAHDWHVLRAAVTATTEALGMLVAGRARIALEYADLVSAGPARVAVVSLLLVSAQGTERVAGAAPVRGEAPDAAVSATIAAVRHRLGDLLDEAVLDR